MTADQLETMQACARGSLADLLTFPEVVARLVAIGVERYHVDYSRGEVTYYLPDGDSTVLALAHEAHPTASAFSTAEVASAVRQSQRGEHSYAEFIRKTMAAGCVGYFAQLAGRRVIYFGRNGDQHVERFPEPA